MNRRVLAVLAVVVCVILLSVGVGYWYVSNTTTPSGGNGGEIMKGIVFIDPADGVGVEQGRQVNIVLEVSGIGDVGVPEVRVDGQAWEATTSQDGRFTHSPIDTSGFAPGSVHTVEARVVSSNGSTYTGRTSFHITEHPVPTTGPRFLYDFDLPEVIYLNYSTWPPTQMDNATPEEMRRGVSLTLDDAAARGYRALLLLPFDREEATSFYTSPSLADAGFTLSENGDLLDFLFREAQYRGFTVDINIEDIAHILLGDKPYDKKRIKPAVLTPEKVKGVVRELSTAAKNYGIDLIISEEAFNDSYITAIEEEANVQGITYMHAFDDPRGRADIWMSEDYATYPPDVLHDPQDQVYFQNLFRWGSDFGRLGCLDVMFAQANGLDKKVGVITSGGWGLRPGAQKNIVLMRSAQYHPIDLYGILAAGYDEPPYDNMDDIKYVRDLNITKDILPDISEFGRSRSDIPKPRANVIFVPPTAQDDDALGLWDVVFEGTIETIMSSVLAAGYDPYVTYREPYSGGADLYYVLAFGGLNDTMYEELPQPVLDLFGSGTPTFLQTAGILPTQGTWGRVRSVLGLPPDVESVFADPWVQPAYQPVFETVPYMNHTVKYRGYAWEIVNGTDPGAYYEYNVLLPVGPQNVSALVTGEADLDGDGVYSEPVAAITRNNSDHFVNSNILHMEVASILANLMGRGTVFHVPALVYLTRGESRTTVFAADTVDMDIQLEGDYSSATLVEFDDAGNRMGSTSITLTGGRLTGQLAKWHLLVVVA